jgi:ABC-type dipeptide/oligopeptide/nickel transport system permease subunit
MPNNNEIISSNVWRRLRRNRGAVFGMTVIGLSLVLALAAYYIAPDHSPNANRIILEIGGRRPGFTQQFLLVKKERSFAATPWYTRLVSGNEDRYEYVPANGLAGKEDSLVKRTFWLGTDKYGRDILSRLIIGVRVSLAVGLITVVISLTIGVLLGALAGYFGGFADGLVMWLLNVIWSIPTLLLVFGITLLLGKGFWQVFIAIGLSMWVNVARIVRGQVLVVKQFEFIEAARALGFSTGRILFKHILPNILGPVMVVAASNFASAIVIEAGLSFLGIGVQPPQPSWGLMIKENYNFIITHNPMLALAPGLAIMLLVLAFNLLGNGLRDALNVKP